MCELGALGRGQLQGRLPGDCGEARQLKEEAGYPVPKHTRKEALPRGTCGNVSSQHTAVSQQLYGQT